MFKMSEGDKKFFWYFMGFSLLYLLPVLIHNTPYNDDFSRIIVGNSWDDDGRFLPSLLIRFFGHARTVYSVVPLPLILAIPILSLGGLLIKRTFIEVQSPWISVLIASGFLLNPFLMLLFVYQLDSLGLALSLVLLIVPFTYSFKYQINGFKKAHIICILCLFFSLNSYQASIGFFMALAVIEYVFASYQGRYSSLLPNILSRVFQFLSAYVLYKGFLSLPFIANVARRPGRTGFIEISSGGMEGLINNFLEMMNTVVTSLSGMQLLIFAILTVWCLLFLGNNYRCSVLVADSSRFIKVLLFFSYLLSPFVILVFSCLHLSVLDGFFKLQAITSFSGITAFLFLVVGWSVKNHQRRGWILLPVILSAIGFSYLVGNYVKIEKDFHNSIITAIVADVNEFAQVEGVENKLYYWGELPHSPYHRRVVEAFPMLKTMNTTNDWSIKYRLPYLGCGIKPERISAQDIPKSLSLLMKSYHYKIYQSDKYLFLQMGHR